MLFLSVFQKATLVQNLTQLRMSHFYSDLLNPCLGNPCEHAGTCRYEDCVMTCDCAPYRTGPLCDEGNNRSNENNNSRVTPLSVYSKTFNREPSNDGTYSGYGTISLVPTCSIDLSKIPITEQFFIRNKKCGPEPVPCLEFLLYNVYFVVL